MSKIDIIHDLLTLAAVVASEPDSMWHAQPELSTRHARCMYKRLNNAVDSERLLKLGVRRATYKDDCFHCRYLTGTTWDHE